MDKKLIKSILEKNKLDPSLLVKLFTSGQINHVYAVDDKYVLKVQGDGKKLAGILRGQKALLTKLNEKGAKVPQVMAEGEIEGRGYLLMEKLPGKNLVYDWLSFTDKQKESFISQIAEQLKIYHSITYADYAFDVYKGKFFSNLKAGVRDMTRVGQIDKTKLKKEYAESVAYLEDFFAENIAMLDETDTAVLTHNDIHFENIFYVADKITGIIDFDWHAQAPKDFDLYKIIDFAYEPKGYVEKKLEPEFSDLQLEKEVRYFKKYYPELFAVPNLAKRLRLYFVQDSLRTMEGYIDGTWSENVAKAMTKKIDIIYKSNWLDNLIS